MSSHHGASRMLKAFQDADADCDGILMQDDFLRFVELGLGKQCGPQMYIQTCAHTGRDPSLGLGWLHIQQIFQISQNASPAPPDAPQTSPNVPRRRHNNNHSMSISTSEHQRNLSQSRHGLTSEYLDRHNRTTSQSQNSQYDQLSDVGSDTLSDRRGSELRRVATQPIYPSDNKLGMHNRGSSTTEVQITDILQRTNITLEKKVKELEKKYKSEHRNFKLLQKERNGIITRLEQQNGQLRHMDTAVHRSNEEMETQKSAFSERSEKYEEQIRLMQAQLDDDRKTIAHLQGQHNLVSTERDQVLSLFKSAEQRFEAQIAGLNNKHKLQLEKVSSGFLESLGADPDRDVKSVINELKEHNRVYQQQINLLAEQLTRKDRSLFEALQAIDILSQDDANSPMDTIQTPHGDNYRSVEGSSSQRSSVTGFGAPNASFFIQAMSPEPPDVHRQMNGHRPPSRRSSRSNMRGQAVGPHGQLKEMEFINTGITSDLLGKQEKLEDLQAANSVLGQQFLELQLQHDRISTPHDMGDGSPMSLP